MTSFGLIARGDDGGLGQQTFEIARHLNPDRILVVNLAERGRLDLGRYGPWPTRVCGNPPTVRDVRWLLEADVIFTVETFYQDAIVGRGASDGRTLWVHANPELFPGRYRTWSDEGLIRVGAPTPWEVERLGPHVPLPMPVARDRVPFRLREGPARTFLHVSAPAMLDRNGTGMVQAACRLYSGPKIRLYVSGPARPAVEVRVGDVEVWPLEHFARYGDLYATADVLVVPRRYGGLSLVMQEALAAGMPVVTLIRRPEMDWPGTVGVPIVGHEAHRMKGGPVQVASGDPAALAETLRWLATTDVAPISARADGHARAISWPALLPEWRQTLGLTKDSPESP